MALPALSLKTLAACKGEGYLGKNPAMFCAQTVLLRTRFSSHSMRRAPLMRKAHRGARTVTECMQRVCHTSPQAAETANVSRGRPAVGRCLHVTNSTTCVEFWGRHLILHSKPTRNIKCRFMFSLNHQLLFNLSNNKNTPRLINIMHSHFAKREHKEKLCFI